MKYWYGTVKVKGFRIKFHDAPGFELQEFVPKVGWVNADEVAYRLIPSQLLDAIRAFRPNYPLNEVMREENGE